MWADVWKRRCLLLLAEDVRVWIWITIIMDLVGDLKSSIFIIQRELLLIICCLHDCGGLDLSLCKEVCIVNLRAFSSAPEIRKKHLKTHRETGHSEIPANPCTNTESVPTLKVLFLTGLGPVFQNVRYAEQESVVCFRWHLDRKLSVNRI